MFVLTDLRVGAHRRARVREQCAIAVEFALVLPLLVMLLLGLTTTGLAYNDSLAINNAVRESARLGAAVDYNTGATAWANAVQTRVQQTYYNQGSSITTSQICVKLVNSSGSVVTDSASAQAVPSSQGTSCGTEPSAPTGMASGTCAVKVWVQKPRTITLGVLPTLSFNIGARSVAFYGRTTGSCSTTT